MNDIRTTLVARFLAWLWDAPMETPRTCASCGAPEAAAREIGPMAFMHVSVQGRRAHAVVFFNFRGANEPVDICITCASALVQLAAPHMIGAERGMAEWLNRG